MTSHYVWSVIPADNADSDSNINWKELQPPDTVNNSARQMMARGAEWRLDMANVRQSTGAANTYEITVQSDLTATGLVAGMMFAFRAHQTNTGACTLSVNTLTKPLRSISGQDLGGNGILNGQAIIAFYNAIADEFLFPYANGVQQGGPAQFESLDIGTDDTTTGQINLFGGNIGDNGGVLRVYNSASQDDPTEYYQISGNSANGHLEIARSNGTASDIVIEDDGRLLLASASGNVDVGTSGVVRGFMRLLGAAGTAVGSVFQLAKATGVTGNGGNWQIDTNAEELNFSSGDPAGVIFRLNADTQTAQVTQLGTGTVQSTNGVLSTAAFTYEPPLGQGQAWRSAGTQSSGTNLTGRTIMVWVRDNPAAQQTLSVSGVTVGIYAGTSSSQGQYAIVPDGASWNYTASPQQTSILD